MLLERQVFYCVHFSVLGMFDDQHAVFGQKSFLKNHCRNALEFFLVHVIRRIGKDDVVFRRILFQESKDVSFDGGDVEVKFLSGFLDELDAPEIFVDTRDVIRAARSEFVTDVSGSGKKIEYFQAAKVEMVVQDVEQRFFAHVGRWADGQIFWRADAAAFVCSGDDAQGILDFRFQNAF